MREQQRRRRRSLASDTPGHPARGRTVIAAGLLAHGSTPYVRPSRGCRLSGIAGQAHRLQLRGQLRTCRTVRSRAPHSLLAPDHRSAEPRWSRYVKRLAPGQRESFPLRRRRLRAPGEWAALRRESWRRFARQRYGACVLRGRSLGDVGKNLARFAEHFARLPLWSRYSHPPVLDSQPRTLPDVGVTVPLGRKTWWRRWEAGELHSDATNPALPPQL